MGNDQQQSLAVQSEAQSSAADWSEAYRVGDHRGWDHTSPSAELVGYILGSRPAPRARVLDLGCGTGADGIFLAAQNYEVHGLDFSAEALRLARQRAAEANVTITWYECSALNTPFCDGYCDLITDRGCCHYMRGSVRRQYAEEVARILRPGGSLFLRGCRDPEDAYFATIDRDSLAESFDPRLFKIGPVIPFYLAVDSGGICANAVTIVRTFPNPD
jgi:ubiquinone/menaquinone biosynthesis C-methylase UbiE